jgi:LPPG:FO 2-phospho-L-lactate transferase
MARGLAAVLPPDELAVVVNVGDDDVVYGAHVSADVDTVVYTLAGIEGPEGWGIAGDSFTVMEAMEDIGVDTTFRLGDRDLAVCLSRTAALDEGEPLSEITGRIARTLGVETRVLPVSDDAVRTRLETTDGAWLDFQEYFVIRGHRDEVASIRYDGADDASPAPGVIEAIGGADLLVIAPSNPPLSVWPILAVPGVREAVEAADRVVAVSPLFGGKALKGPADRVMASLGLPPGNQGVAAAYQGLLTDLVIDQADAGDEIDGVKVHAMDTRIADPAAAASFAARVLEL